MSKFLDLNGLSYFWDKITAKLGLKVDRAGDMMTGQLSFINDEIDRDAAAPSAKQYGQKMPVWSDVDGERIGYIQAVRNIDGKVGLQITPVNEKLDGTDAYGAFSVFVDETGETSYGVNNAVNFRSAINAVNKSGDTFTGSVVFEPPTTTGAAYIYMDQQNLDRDATSPSANVGNARIMFRDKDNETMGRVAVGTDSSGNAYLSLAAYSENSSHSEISNGITIYANKSGTKTYSVGDADNFRSAIGAAPTTAATASANGLMPRGYIHTQLYNNTTGSSGTITLSASAANYNHLRIFYKFMDDSNGNVTYGSVDVYGPNNKRVDMPITRAYSGTFAVYHGWATISTTSITKNQTGYCWITSSDQGQVSTDNHIFIVRVEGWNE